MWYVVPAVGSLLLTLAWIGWRFFYPSPPASDGRPSGVSLCARDVWRNFFAERVLPWQWRNRRTLGWVLLSASVTAAVVTATLHAAVPPELPLATPKPHAHHQHIEQKLAEAHLVPPPPLPPSAFVALGDPSMAAADRDWSKLDPAFARQLLAVMERMRSRGYPLALIEGYRSPMRQNTLAASPQRRTRAIAFQSKHQFGLAADLAPVHDGRLVLSERDPWAWETYQALGKESEAAGLTWGGRWSLQDYGHVEARSPLTGELARTAQVEQ